MMVFSQVPLLVQDRHRGRHGRGKDNALGRRGGVVAPPRVKRQQCWDQFSSKVRVDNNEEELSCVRMSAVVHLFHLSFVFCVLYGAAVANECTGCTRWKAARTVFSTGTALGPSGI